MLGIGGHPLFKLKGRAELTKLIMAIQQNPYSSSYLEIVERICQ